MLLNNKVHIFFYCFWYDIYFEIIFFNLKDVNHNFENYGTQQGFAQILDIFQ